MRQKADWVDASLIAEDWNWLLMDPDDTAADIQRRRTLDMPLRGRGRFGTLLSAVYRSRSTRELHMLRGAVDIETALRVHEKDSAGFFIMRPRKDMLGFDERTLNEVENNIDFVVWRLRKDARINAQVEDEEETMAERILEWGDA
ncbi:hypothetical protein QWY84_18625 [Aquisalimonas lutea]|uniref:hypothetical protein n=1 Tax=Aquisalimonas lutea TaxID=1327750 RepID=UPI0025B4BC07|nr:hypothetical protein [Aquisalimonas lutea]MDN3519627.1 hypothetical protein [Aquisalimonas lutea]